jgi:phospholipid/cholesterol/gamma-HCH transport system ATP-binding protein
LPPFPDPVAEPAVAEIEKLSFAYEREPVLHGIDVRIPRGKVVAVMGQSGCGKTTLLRVIAAALLPTGGRARVLGEDTAALDRDGLYALRRRMGMLFQFGALFTDMSVFDNVAFQMREHTRPAGGRDPRPGAAQAEAVGLRGAAHLMPGELSGGMARRVALARAVALDPS